jgi:hypothetical protein
VRLSRLLFGVGLPAVLLAATSACAGDGTGLNCDPATVSTLTIGVKVTDALDTGHCISGGDAGDLFQFSLGGTTVIRFTAISDKFPPEFTIAKPSASPSNDDEILFNGGSPARAVAVLPAGQYVLDVQSGDNGVGAYTLASDIIPLNQCFVPPNPNAFIAAGTTLSSSLETTDCMGPSEVYQIRLRGGRSYTFTATSGISQYNLLLGKDNSPVAGSGVITTNGTATITYTPPSSGYYTVAVGAVGGRTGAYTLSITP